MSTRISPTLRTSLATSLALVSLLGLTAAPTVAATWQMVSQTGPSPRSGAEMVYDSARGRVVLFGGYDGTVHGDTWEWDGASWTQVSTSGPPARWQSGMAYDVQRGVSVLFGGHGSTTGCNVFGDTWEWDGTAWTLADAGGPNSPPARGVSGQMAFDMQRNVTVLFGGTSDCQNPLSDTWEWDGSQWALVSSTGPARAVSQMVYDSASQVSLIFGGIQGYNILADTWGWSGSAWSQLATTGPSPRYAHNMAFDTGRARAVMFGGWSGSSSLGDTWEWGGTAWAAIDVPGPSPRHNGPMAYDSTRGVTVLFGGTLDGSLFYGDTWEYTGDPTITLSLDCGGISACPMGTFGYRAVVTNPAQTTLTLRVAIAPGIGVPSPVLLLNQPVTGSTEIVHEYTTSDQIPNVCPTQVKVRAALLDSGATVVARDTCRIDFLPLTP